MNRGLKITIHERAGASSRPANSSSTPGSNSDPGTSYVMPPPEDPGTSYVMPPPEDPGTSYVMPPPEDPSAGSGSAQLPAYSGSGGCDTVVTVSTCDCGCGCTCGCAAPAGQQPAGSSASPASIPGVTARDYSGFVIVRLAEGVVGSSQAENLWTLAKSHQPELPELEAVLELPISSGTSGQTTSSGSSQRTAIPATDVTATAAGGPPASLSLPQPPPGALVSRPLVELRNLDNTAPLPRADCLTKIRGLENSAATSPFPPLHSLTAYWRIDLRQHPDLMDEVVRRLNSLAEVDLVYEELTAKDPSVGQTFADDQGYLADAPAGISASWAWQSLTPGTTPQPRICDLEQGWIQGHQDLKDGNTPIVPTAPLSSSTNKFIFGGNRAPSEGSDGYHGAAVLGQLAATGTGVKGAAAGYAKFLLASHYRPLSDLSSPFFYPFAGTSGHVAAAIVQALTFILPASSQTSNLPSPPQGDILLLEVQRNLLPTEVDEADFDAIRLASAQNVVVVEAAGNGGVNLDGYVVAETGRSLSRSSSQFGESGAILVGAARAALPHDRAPFSNYGSRLDCYGWGETVTSCGFGDLAGTAATNYYTNSFNGTSSASPIIADAAALVQALYNQQAGASQTGTWLDPRAMRAVLSDPSTGTHQGPNVAGFIGVMPDLRAIARGSMGLVADIYMRRHIGDDGSRPAPSDEISSSPDILMWKATGTGVGTAAARFGEGLRANTPAPGSLLNTGTGNPVYPNDFYIRLRNRGGVEGQTVVQLFASPAATLITPERWLPLGSVAVQHILPGDTLTVSPPLTGLNLPNLWLSGQLGGTWSSSFTALWPSNAVPPPFSLLAVQVPWDAPTDLPTSLQRPTPLPPGPPYFDWAKTRAFLRGPGVAWRNAYPITAGPNITLAFLIAGTPDQIRHFDFEVIQRLPTGAAVTLTVPYALAAKLRQRQPALVSTGNLGVSGGIGATGPLTLPKRPRTAIRGVELAAGTCSPAAFNITTTGTPLLATGHSLAIRQLWKGEEVGRITWWFITQNDPEAD